MARPRPHRGVHGRCWLVGWTQEDVDAVLKRQDRAKTATNGSGATTTHKAKKRPKYGNKAVLVDLGPKGEVVGGHLRLVHTFPSGREAAHYAELKLRRHAGEITDLRLQEPYALIVQRPDGQPQLVGEWLADFDYRDSTGRHVVDAKGKKTDMYILKKKIVEACHAITIEEV